MIGIVQSVALSLGGVGFSSPLLALRGRVLLGQGSPGCAHAGASAASSGLGGVEATSGGVCAAEPVSAALGGARGISGAILDSTEESGAVVGVDLECTK